MERIDQNVVLETTANCGRRFPLSNYNQLSWSLYRTVSRYCNQRKPNKNEVA